MEVIDSLHHEVIIGLPDLPKVGLSITGLPSVAQTHSTLLEHFTQESAQVPELADSSSFLRANEDQGRQDTSVEALFIKGMNSELQINNSIPAGEFCSLPESVVHLGIPQDHPGVFKRQYPVPHKMRPYLDKQVQEWLDTKVIEEVKHHSKWNSPLLAVVDKVDPVSKEILKVRVCLDPRHLNMLIPSVNYPIPLEREIFEALSGSNYFTSLDLVRSFHQFELAPADREVTTFTWQGTQYQFRGVPFGLKPISSIFQRVMGIIFKDSKPFIVIFVDDIVIHSRTAEDHAIHVQHALRLLNQHNLKLNQTKSHFFRTAIEVLGHIVSKSGVRVSHRKLQDEQRFRAPTSTKEVQSDLGFFNYFRKFIPNYAQLTAPLERIKNEADIQKVWTTECEDVYSKLKQILFSDLLLSFPDFTKPFCIATDASNLGVGAMLYQEEEDGTRSYVAFASSALNAGQRNYPATKKELYAIIFALNQFRQYIWGTHFTLYTDHRALTYLFTVPGTSPMLNNWLEILLDFDFDIKHRPGILNVIPDYLSRIYTRKGPAVHTVSDSKPSAVLVSDMDTESSQLNSLTGRQRVDDPRSNWMLNPKLFHKINQLYKHDCDAFATASNTQIPNAYWTFEEDAFKQDWTGKRLWINPPWSLIDKVIDKLIQDQAVATIITPKWDNKKWYNKLRAISIASPIILPRSHDLFLPLSTNNTRGVGEPEWDVIAWRVSGIYTKETNKYSKLQEFPYLSQVNFAIGQLMSMSDELPESTPAPVNSRSLGAAVAEVSAVSADYTVSAAERVLAVQRAHLAGHFGAMAMYKSLILNGMNWTGMLKQCQDFCASCAQCQKFTIGKHGYHPLRSIHADLPFDHLAIDLAGPFAESEPDNYVHLLIVADVATRFVFLRPVKDMRTETIADALLRICFDVGFPKVIQSDNGGSFVSDIMDHWMKTAQIDHRLITPYHPRANGLAERTVQTAKQAIFKHIQGQESQWAHHVPAIQYFINTKVSAIHNSTPYSLMFGRPHNLFSDFRKVEERTPTEVELKARLTQLTEIIYPSIRAKSEATARRNAELKDTVGGRFGKTKRRQEISFPDGSWVMATDSLRTSKAQPRYLGPFQVIKRNTGGAYLLRDAQGNSFPRAPEHLKAVIRTTDETKATLYNAKAILDHRGDKPTYEYLISWFTDSNHPQESWIPYDCIENQELIQAYWKRVERDDQIKNPPILKHDRTLIEQHQQQTQKKRKAPIKKTKKSAKRKLKNQSANRLPIPKIRIPISKIPPVSVEPTV